PADAAGRHAGHQGESRNILGYHCARGNEAIRSKSMAAYDGCIRANGRATLHDGFSKLSLAADVGARVQDIRKHAARSAKYVIFQDDTFVQSHVVLQFTPIADTDMRPDHDVLPENRILPDDNVRENMDEVPHLAAGPDR